MFRPGCRSQVKSHDPSQTLGVQMAGRSPDSDLLEMYRKTSLHVISGSRSLSASDLHMERDSYTLDVPHSKDYVSHTLRHTMQAPNNDLYSTF